MDYFLIANSTNASEIGVYPQIQTGVLLNHDLSSLIFEKAEEGILVPKGELHKKAKMTDLLSASFFGLSSRLIVSQDLHEILLAAKSEGIQHLATSIILPDKSEKPYWVLNPFNTDFNFVDFKKSKFILTNRMLTQVLDEVTFDNAASFIHAYKQNRKDAIEKSFDEHKVLLFDYVAIKEDCNLDCFSLAPIRGVSAGIFVTEKLKKVLLKYHYTGIAFKEINQQYV